MTIIEEQNIFKNSVEQFKGFLESHEQWKNKHTDEKNEEMALQAKFTLKYKMIKIK